MLSRYTLYTGLVRTHTYRDRSGIRSVSGLAGPLALLAIPVLITDVEDEMQIGYIESNNLHVRVGTYDLPYIQLCCYY